MIYRVQLAEQAKRDLRGIYEYFAFKRQEPRLGSKIKQRIVEKLKTLNEMTYWSLEDLVDKKKRPSCLLLNKTAVFFAHI